MLHLIKPFQNSILQSPDGASSQSLVPDEVTHENESEVRLGKVR